MPVAFSKTTYTAGDPDSQRTPTLNSLEQRIESAFLQAASVDHDATHLPGGSDAIDWAGSIIRSGTIAARPAAAAGNAGTLYFATDDTQGGTMYRSSGSAWVKIAPALAESVSVAGGSTIQPVTTGTTGLILKAIASQTAPLLDFRSNLNAQLGRIDASGKINLTGLMPVYIDDGATFGDLGADAALTIYKQRYAPVTGKKAIAYVKAHMKQAGSPTDGHNGFEAHLSDHPSHTKELTVTDITVGANPVATVSVAHPWVTGDRIRIHSVAGMTGANGLWTITVLTTTTFRLEGATTTGTYTASSGRATSRGLFYCYMATVVPTVARGGIPVDGGGQFSDDVNGYVLYNGASGQFNGTDAYYIGHNPIFTTVPEWIVGFNCDADVYYGFRLTRKVYTAGIDTSPATPQGSAPMIKLGAGHHIQLDTVTGTKIGTATTQKLAFFNSTPITKPTVTGSRGGNAALASLLTQLAALGLVVDSTTA
jgi:hypothetical protein